jgi:hypothetical protein
VSLAFCKKDFHFMGKLKDGVDILGERPKPDAEILEKIEPANERTSDHFDLVLGEVLKAQPGGYMSNRLFDIPVQGSDYPDELVFDRWYFDQNLLVDFFQAPLTEYERTNTASIVARKTAYANGLGAKYLPIIGGASITEIAEIVMRPQSRAAATAAA